MRDSKSGISQSFVFSEFIRCLNNIVRFGTIAEVDYKKARVRVKTGKITTTWIPWATMAGGIKIWNPPVVGEQVSVIAQGGDLSLAIAIPSIYQNKFNAPSDDENVVRIELSDKVFLEFSKENNEITAKIEEAELFFSKDTFTVKFNDSEFVLREDNIEAKCGESEAKINENKIRFSVGSSRIEITPEKISIDSPIVDIPNFKVGI